MAPGAQAALLRTGIPLLAAGVDAGTGWLLGAGPRLTFSFHHADKFHERWRVADHTYLGGYVLGCSQFMW